MMLLYPCVRAPCVACSGNVVIETRFYEGDLLVSKSLVRVIYV